MNAEKNLTTRRSLLARLPAGLMAMPLGVSGTAFSATGPSAAPRDLFRIRALDRKYDHHRERGCTLLAIEVTYWPGNEFGLWMPETVFLSGKTVWGNWWEDAHQEFEQDPQGRWITRRVFDQFTITSVLTPDPSNSCLWYRHTFENTTRDTLQGLNTQTCFHLVNAPQFISLQGSRIWASLDGRWMTTDKVERDQSPDPRRVVFLRHGLRKERTVVPIRSFPSAIMPETAHHPLFIAENFEGNGSVGIASRDFEKLFNNNDPILRCLHSEPLPLAQLEPGRKAHQDSVIIFWKGDHKALIRHYHKRIALAWHSD